MNLLANLSISPIWHDVASITHFAGACACATVAAIVLRQRRQRNAMGATMVACLLAGALWCLAVAVSGGRITLAGEAAQALRDLAWLLAVYRLFASDGRHTSVAPVRPVVWVLATVALLKPVLMVIIGGGAGTALQVFRCNTVLGLLEVVAALVLVHNLYVGASAEARRVLRWPALAFGIVWSYELNLYTVAWLGHQWPVPLAALHGLADVAFAVMIALGNMAGNQALRIKPSRAVTFRLISLLAIGGYFLAMVFVAQWLADAGGDFARWLQFGFLVVAVAALLVVMPSRRLRGWLRVTLAKNFFQHRYDYRAEWLRFTHTVSRVGSDAKPLNERAIQALADITDSPAGLLLMPDAGGDLVLAARWQWQAKVPAPAYPGEAVDFLRRNDFILDLGEQAGRAGQGDAFVPAWLADDPRAWALVPLLHFERLVGAVVLARPPHPRALDWEDFDLLRVAGQQLASYLAEQIGQEALAEAGRFDDFNRRIAFVMHDIKNLASQFSLLARNAERHADNPAFRADMLVTLRASADKLNALMARLSRYGAGGGEGVAPVAVGALARDIAARHPAGRVTLIDRDPCEVAGNAHALEQVLAHLVQNGVDASIAGAGGADSPVFIQITREEPWCRIDIVDSGGGMSPEFVRTRLFRPFDSTKPGGFGIGAYEARELVRAMQGRLDVESREGLGTRFVVRLPLASTATLLNPGFPEAKAVNA